MCVRPLKSDSITAASIYHAVDREHPTLLIDEADNLGLAFNGAALGSSTLDMSIPLKPAA
jgi:hypothetical protein